MDPNHLIVKQEDRDETVNEFQKLLMWGGVNIDYPQVELILDIKKWMDENKGYKEEQMVELCKKENAWRDKWDKYFQDLARDNHLKELESKK